MNRRKVLKNIGSGIGAITLTPSIVSLFESCQTQISYDPLFFSKEDFKILSNLMELIIPETEIPGAKKLRLPEFLDSYIDAVLINDKKIEFAEGFSAFKKEALKSSGKENFTQLTNENLDDQLAKYLKSSKTLAKGNRYASEFAYGLRDLTVEAFKINEYIGENVLAYVPVPGDYKGCVDLMGATEGKAWSL
jgi:hypothetical protein